LTPTLVILTTGLDPGHEPARIAAAPPQELGRHLGANPGKSIFNIFCSSCHGRSGVGGEGGPPLLNETNRKNFAAIVEWIKNPAPPMPNLSPPLSNSEVEAVAHYVEQLK
jgi:mono/diheme cytochrome c family protein